jgi:ERCC4-type nuclease
MDLTFWQNKNNPSMIRVYLKNINAFNESRQIWSERIGKSNTWRINSRENLSESEKVSFKNLLVEHLQLSGASKSDSVLFDSVINSAKTKIKKDYTSTKTRSTFAGRTSQQDKSKLIPELTTIKVPDPVKIEIDHREPEELFEYLSKLENVEVTKSALAVGDIVINDQIIIERKCCEFENGGTDFERSIIDDSKRLFNQSEKMKFTEDTICIILLEGDVYGESKSMLVQQIDGAISFLSTIQKLSVLSTYNLKHTAYIILKMATHHKSGLGYELGLRKKKPKGLLDQKRFILEGLPGISSELAKRLLDEFGSIKKIMNATAEDFRKVEGLGTKKVEALVAVLSESTTPQLKTKGLAR